MIITHCILTEGTKSEMEELQSQYSDSEKESLDSGKIMVDGFSLILALLLHVQILKRLLKALLARCRQTMR